MAARPDCAARARRARGRRYRIANHGRRRASRHIRLARLRRAGLGRAAQMGANALHDQPFGARRERLAARSSGQAGSRRSRARSPARLALRATGSSSSSTATPRAASISCRRAAANEERVAAPGEGHGLAGLDRREVDLDRGQRQHVGRRIHLIDQAATAWPRRPLRSLPRLRCRGSRVVSDRRSAYDPRSYCPLNITARRKQKRAARAPAPQQRAYNVRIIKKYESRLVCGTMPQKTRDSGRYAKTAQITATQNRHGDHAPCSSPTFRRTRRH